MPCRKHLRGAGVGVYVLGWDLRLLSSLSKITHQGKTNPSHQLLVAFCFFSQCSYCKTNMLLRMEKGGG